MKEVSTEDATGPSEFGKATCVQEVAQDGSLEVPSVIGDYRMMRWIGVGGMGVVYLARDEVLGRRVAIKLLSRHLFGSPKHVAMFLVEARILACFNHPNIVTVYSAGDVDGYPYLAMEYIEGRTLSDRVQEEPLRGAEARRVGLGIATALREAHDQQVVHGDLKPQNVIIGRGGRPRVVDFGLARMVSVARHEAETDDGDPDTLPPDALRWAAHTGAEADPNGAQRVVVQARAATSGSRRAGRSSVMGTIPYLAPEQWSRGAVDTAADIWAFGVMMYELLCGKHPYLDANTPAELRARVTGAQPAPRLQTRLDVSPRLANAVDACLAKKPCNRPTANELVDLLSRLTYRSGSRGQPQECPFRGLEAFSERHARFFFGRTEEIGSFIERIRVQPVLPVVGASGVGKSSFVQAGIVPRLRELDEWSIIRIRPGKNPFGVLACSLNTEETRSHVRPSAAAYGSRTRSAHMQPACTALAEDLFEHPKRLASLLAEQARAERVRVLLLVDQMEEVVTMVADREVRDRFIDAVCGAADDRHEPVRVIFTARDDFLSRLAENRSMRRVLESVTVLHLPGKEALAEIMTMPLHAVGYDYDDATLVPAMVEAAGGDVSALPLLQFTASLLWEERDAGNKRLCRCAYDAIGGVQGALASHADGVLKELDVDDTRVVRDAMLRLVTPEGTRRTVEQQEMVDSLGPRAEHLLKRLSDARLLSASSVDDVVQYELSHESLVHTWDRLRRWLDEGREESIFLSELGQAAALWSQRGRRRTETWTGDALSAALRNIDRFETRLASTTLAFIEACRKAERARLRRRKGVLAAAFALLALVAIVSTVKEREAVRERREAERQKQLARMQRAQADAEGARAALLAGKPLEARARVRRSLETADSPLARTLWRELSYEPLLWRVELGGVVGAAAITADGKLVAAGEYSGLISVFDAETAAVRVRLRGQKGPIWSIAISSDGRYLAYGNQDGETGLWDLSTRTASRATAHEAHIENVQFAAAQNEVVSAGADGRAFVWQVDGWKPRPLGAKGQSAKGLAIGPGGEIAVGRADGTLELWPSTSALAPRTLHPSQVGIEALAFAPSPAGKLAVGSSDGRVALLDLRSGATEKELQGHTALVTGLVFSRDGKRVYSSAFDQRLLAWDAITGRKLASFDGHEAGIYGLAVNGNSKRLVSAGLDRSVRLWDGSLLARSAKPTGHQGAVIGVAVTPDGKLLVSSGNDNTVRVWNVASGEQLATGRGHDDVALRVAVSRDGRRAVTASLDGTARVWSLPAAKQERVLVGHQGSVYATAFVGDDRVATASWDGTVRLWRIEDGACVAVLTVGVPTLAVAVSSSASLIVAGGAQGTVRLWRRPFSGPGIKRDFAAEPIYDLAFAPHSAVVGAAAGPAVVVWDDITQSAPPRILTQSNDDAVGVGFSPDGKELAVGRMSSGRLARWHLESGEVSVFRGHRGEVSDVAYSPDGRVLATAGDDGTLRTWRTSAVAPLWRMGVMLSEPLEGAFTHQGWVGAALDGEPRQWQEAVESASSVARQAGKMACIPTSKQGVQLWSLEQDKIMARAAKLRPQILRAVAQGCLVVDEAANAWLLTEGAEPLLLEKGVRAVGRHPERPLLATDRQIVEYDASGGVLRSAAGEAGVTAVATVGAQLAVGYGDGSIEMRSWDGKRRRPLLDTGTRRVTYLAEGTGGTVMAGYGDGLFGLWLSANGGRLLGEKLHGPITEVHQRGSIVRVASALGEIRDLDLQAFTIPYCELLSQVGESVAVTWGDGVPVLQPAQSTADCEVAASGLSGSAPPRRP